MFVKRGEVEKKIGTHPLGGSIGDFDAVSWY